MCLSTVGDVYSSIGFRNLIKDDVLVVEWLWVSLRKSLIIGIRNHLWTLSCSKVQILWEGHTIWKNNTRVHAIFFESLSINVKTKWETDFFSNFCGLLRIFELNILLHFLVCSCMPLKSGVRQKGSRQMLHVRSIVVKNCFSNHWGERSQCIKRWIS